VRRTTIARAVARTVLTALAIGAAAAARAETGFLDRSVTIGAASYRYQVYVPADFTAARTWPVILYLHGGGAQGHDAMLPTVGGLANDIRAYRDKFPVIAVFPQASPDATWSQTDMQEMAFRELDQTMTEFHGDPARIYLAGYSMGGVGAYRIAYRYPQKFAAMVVIAGRVDVSTARGGGLSELDRKLYPFLADKDPFSALAKQIKSIPCWLFHGDADESVPVEQSRKLTAALQKAGAFVRYTEYYRGTHQESPNRAFADMDMVTWLLQQHR
jgi:predicted peptidase